MIRHLLIILALCSAAFGQVVVRGIAEHGDTPTTTTTVQTVGALAGDSIIVLYATQGTGCNISAMSWAAGTVTATTTGTGCVSVTVGTIMCVGGATQAGYNACGAVTGSTGTTMSYAVASNPGAYTGGAVFTLNGLAPTDNASGGSNTYVEITGCRNFVSITCWLATNITLAAGSAQPTITCSLANSNFTGITCGTFSVGGLASSSTLDQAVADYTQDLSSETTIITPAITGSVSPELIIAFSAIGAVTGNATTSACGSTFTNYDVGNHDGIGGYPVAYLITSSTGSYCGGLTANAVGPAWPITVSFKGAGAIANNATTHGGKFKMGGKFISQ